MSKGKTQTVPNTAKGVGFFPLGSKQSLLTPESQKLLKAANRRGVDIKDRAENLAKLFNSLLDDSPTKKCVAYELMVTLETMSRWNLEKYNFTTDRDEAEADQSFMYIRMEEHDLVYVVKDSSNNVHEGKIENAPNKLGYNDGELITLNSLKNDIHYSLLIRITSNAGHTESQDRLYGDAIEYIENALSYAEQVKDIVSKKRIDEPFKQLYKELKTTLSNMKEEQVRRSTEENVLTPSKNDQSPIPLVTFFDVPGKLIKELSIASKAWLECENYNALLDAVELQTNDQMETGYLNKAHP